MSDALLDIAALNKEVNGAGNGRPSLRRRIHELEGERDARRLLASHLAERNAATFTRRQKIAALALSALVVVPTYVDLIQRLRGR